MSDHAYRLLLMKHALARSDAELFGHQPRYLEMARRRAALLLSTELTVSRRWIEWEHGPGAEDGQPLAMSLCDLAGAPGAGSIEVADPALTAELVDVAEFYVNPCRVVAMHCTTWGHGGWVSRAG